MPLRFKNKTDYQKLLERPITDLSLTQEQSDILKRLAIETIGDALHFFVRNSRGMMHTSYNTYETMYGPIMKKLEDSGYWAYLEEDE